MAVFGIWCRFLSVFCVLAFVFIYLIQGKLFPLQTIFLFFSFFSFMRHEHFHAVLNILTQHDLMAAGGKDPTNVSSSLLLNTQIISNLQDYKEHFD